MKKQLPVAARLVSLTDRTRLEALLAAESAEARRDADHLKLLAEALEQARVVPPDEVPADVVTLDSQVQIEDLDRRDQRIFTLVLPQEANVQAGKLSVLAPIGAALLGHREGDCIEWPVPRGLRRLRVVRVLEQPARSDARQRQA